MALDDEIQELVLAGEAVLSAQRWYAAACIDVASNAEWKNEERVRLNTVVTEYNGKILRAAGAFD